VFPRADAQLAKIMKIASACALLALNSYASEGGWREQVFLLQRSYGFMRRAQRR
jgi:hypothetical protein